MPNLCLVGFVFIPHLHITFPGCPHSFLAASIFMFLLQQELCCNGHFLSPSLGLLHRHFSFAGSFLSVVITSLCWLSSLWYQAEIIFLHSQAVSEPIPTLPINLHSLSGGWLPPPSTTSKQLCYFLLRLGRNSSLKMCNALSLSSSPCFEKDSPLNTAGQNLVSSLLDLQDG